MFFHWKRIQPHAIFPPFIFKSSSHRASVAEICFTINVLELMCLSTTTHGRSILLPSSLSPPARRIQLLLNYSYFSTADAPFAGADAADVSSGMKLSSRYPIVFCRRLASHIFLAIIDRLKKTPLLSSFRVDSVTVMDTSR